MVTVTMNVVATVSVTVLPGAVTVTVSGGDVSVLTIV
jgi:hypothetical protein